MANYDEKKKLREKERQKAQKKQNRKWKQAAGTEGATASYWLLAPLIAIFTFIPLVVIGYQYDTKLDVFDWYVSEKEQLDYFFHGKMVLLIIAGIYMAVMLGYIFFKNKRRLPWNPQMIPLAIYGILTILSAILSENSYFSFVGIMEQFEPLWILLTYCIITYYAYVVLHTEESIKKVMSWFIVGIGIILAICAAQGLGKDPFKVPWVFEMISPDGVQWTEDIVETVGGAYATLGNSNYVGVYVVMVIPVLAGIFLSTHTKWRKGIAAILLVLSLYALYSSKSKAGMIILFILSIILLIVWRSHIKEYGKAGIGIAVLLMLSIVSVLFLNRENLTYSIKNIFKPVEAVSALKSIETKKDCVRITYNDEVVDFYNIVGNSGKLDIAVTDGNGMEVESVYNEETGYHTIQDTRFPFVYAPVSSDTFIGFTVNIEGYPWVFSNLMEEGDSSYYAYENEKGMKLKKETGNYNDFFDKHYGMASGRGFIWSRTLPLLKKYFWIGSGPDTFLLAFPNDDLVGKVTRGVRYQYFSKPHSLYLQIGVQTGIPSLLCILTCFIWYLVDSVKIYRRIHTRDYLLNLGAGISVSVIGYLLMGVTNDSMVSISPIFYGLLGTGISINQILKKRQKCQKIT